MDIWCGAAHAAVGCGATIRRSGVAVLICAGQGASCKGAKYGTILEGRGRGQASRERHVGAGGQVRESTGVTEDARELI